MPIDDCNDGGCVKYVSIDGRRNFGSRSGGGGGARLVIVGLVGLECTRESIVMAEPPVDRDERGGFFLY
jgi:hypothetical protein